MKRGILLWESLLTWFSMMASGFGLIGIGTAKEAGLAVLIAQSLNAATIVYKTGQWNPHAGAMPPSPVVVVQSQPSAPPPVD